MPDMASSFMNRADALRYIPELTEICKYRPTAERLTQLATAYFVIRDVGLSKKLMAKALELDPDLDIALVNMGIICKDLAQYEEAYVYIERAYKVNPSQSYIRLAQSEALLRQGKWLEAWPLYELSRGTKEAAAVRGGVPDSVKMWDGEEEVKLLRVEAEGGTGDVFNFSRWLPELTKRGIKWEFHTYDKLYSIFERQDWCKGHLIDDPKTYCEASHWTTQFALAANLKATPETVPQYPSPLIADPELVEKFKIDRNNTKLPLVGLCWKAAEKFQEDQRVRSLSDWQASRLVAKTDHKVHWINLHYDMKGEYPLSSDPRMNTWEDEMALMSGLDAVVTVDTGPMHLAGAMNIPTLTILGGNNSWFFPNKGSQCQLWTSNRLVYNHGWGFDDAINQAIDLIRNDKFPPKK